MHAVERDVLAHALGLAVCHLRIVVGIGHVVFPGIGLDACIEVHDFGWDAGYGLPPGEDMGRQRACEDDLDVVGPGYLAHRLKVAEGDVFVVGVGVFGYVIGGYIDDDGLRMEGDDVLAEAAEELVGGLAGDAPADVAVALKEVFAPAAPVVSDGIAEEDHLALLLRQLCHGDVAVVITPELYGPGRLGLHPGAHAEHQGEGKGMTV